MPDLAPSHAFIDALARLEERAAAAAVRVWQESRAGLLDMISRNGTQASLAATLQQSLDSIGRSIAAELAASGSGIIESTRAYVAAQLGGQDAPIIAETLSMAPALAAWQASTYGQMLADAQRLSATGASAGEIVARLIIGDGRQSVFDAAAAALALTVAQATWSAANGYSASLYSAIEQREGRRYQRQAIAALDSRTTNCCLRVHGQIVDLDEPFHLTGTPRFSDRVMAPPFHWRCRTATALYTREMERVGTTTEEMRQQARALLAQQRTRGVAR